MQPLDRARLITGETLAEALVRSGETAIERAITVEWSTRMTSTAGYATYRTRQLKFSAIIMPHVPEEEIRQVALHELGHLVAWERYGEPGAGHGKLWKNTMRELGARPDRLHYYHRLPAVIRAAGFPVTVCEGCGFGRGITKRRAKNYRRSTYTHNKCGGRLRVLSPQERSIWLGSVVDES